MHISNVAMVVFITSGRPSEPLSRASRWKLLVVPVGFITSLPITVCSWIFPLFHIMSTSSQPMASSQTHHKKRKHSSVAEASGSATSDPNALKVSVLDSSTSLGPAWGEGCC